MAKAKKTPSTPRRTKSFGGPFLAAAVFCQNILEDSQKNMSVIGITDGFDFKIPPKAPETFPSKENPLVIPLSMFLSFKTGNSPGKHTLKLVVEQPNSKRAELLQQEIDLTTEIHGGCNIRTHLDLGLYSGGVFWFDVYLDGKRLTRMPLRISIERLKPEFSPQQANTETPSTRT